MPDIRYCTLKDAPDVCFVEERSSLFPWPKTLIERDLAGDTPLLYLGAWGKDTLLGFAVLGPCNRGVELANIAVLSEYRRRGIGSQLLIGVSEVALSLGHSKLHLHVRVSHEETHILYEKFAFTGLFVVPGYYADGEDALLMEAPLPLPV